MFSDIGKIRGIYKTTFFSPINKKIMKNPAKGKKNRTVSNLFLLNAPIPIPVSGNLFILARIKIISLFPVYPVT